MKKFYKVTDMEEKPFTLVEVTKTAEGDVVKLAERNSAAERTTIREVENFNQRDFTGKVTEIDGEEYQTLMKDWGVDVAVDPTQGNAAASAGDQDAGAQAGGAGSPINEGEPSTSTDAAVSGEAGSPSDAGSIVSGGEGDGEGDPAVDPKPEEPVADSQPDAAA